MYVRKVTIDKYKWFYHKEAIFRFKTITYLHNDLFFENDVCRKVMSIAKWSGNVQIDASLRTRT